MQHDNIKKIDLTGDPWTLKELFDNWIEAHKNESDELTYPDGTIEAKDFKSSFCKDGFTSYAGNVSNEKIYENRPLFILKEANVSNKDTGKIVENGKCFWFNKHPEERGKIYNRIPECLPCFNEDKNQVFGYMNLNKRGGFGKTNDTRLRKYVNRYQEYIRRQIEIMKPSKIICCGCYDIFMKICYKKDTWAKTKDKPGFISVNDVNIPVYYIYHPAYSGFYKIFGGKK